jgi:hypothetical protein
MVEFVCDGPSPPRLCRVTGLGFSIIPPSPIADWRLGDQDVQTVGRELPCGPRSVGLGLLTTRCYAAP